MKPLKEYKHLMCSGEFKDKIRKLSQHSLLHQTHNTTISGNNFMTILSPSKNSHKKSKKYLSPPKHTRKNIRKCLNNIFSPQKKLHSKVQLYIKEIQELKKVNSILKKKLLQMTKYSKQKLTKVRKQLDRTRELMKDLIGHKFKEYFNVLQGFMITVTDVSSLFLLPFLGNRQN